MRNTDVVDIDVDPRAVRRGLWRRILRYGVPLACIVLVAAGLISSSLYTSAMNKTDVLALSHDLIDAVSARAHTEVRAYLAPAEDAVGTLVAALSDKPFSVADREKFEHMALSILRRTPQLASLYLGTATGDFFMIKRNDRGGFDTKLTLESPEGRTTTWIRRDANDTITATEYDNDDTYDPRTRAWFRNATKTPGFNWSKVYIFFTDRTPGITASMALRHNPHSPYAVVGADIYLNNLSAFLAGLQKQARGRLAIVNGDGEVVAYSGQAQVFPETNNDLRPRTIRDLGLPALDEAFSRMRIEGPHRSIVEIDGKRFVFGTSSLRGAVTRDWWLMLLAPESAYLGFIAVNSRRGLIASSGIIVLSILLAGFLAYQGVAAERNARAARADRGRLDAQGQMLDKLAGLTGLSDPGDDEDLKEASELLCAAEGARRVSIWRLAEGGDLICLDAFDEQTRGHTSGTRIQTARNDDRIGALRDGKPFEIDDSASDPSALHRTYLRAVGSVSVASVPIVSARESLGAVWIEDAGTREAIADDRSLARSVANLLAPRLGRIRDDEEPMQAAERRSRVAATKPGAITGGRAADHMRDRGDLRTASLILRRQQLTSGNGNGTGDGADLFSNATVLALKFLDDRMLAAAPHDSVQSTVIAEVVGRFRDEADTRGVPYVKILTDTILAVDGFGEDSAEAAERLMDLALSIRECCNTVFLAASHEPKFGMGIDSGAIYGSAVGFGGSPFNIWGQPVRVACRLTESAEPGTIQISDATFELLHEVGIFRRRGAFYLDQIGELTTYTLRGRL